MSGPLTGKTIALAEGRQLEDLAAMIEKDGATIRRCPMLSILSSPDVPQVRAWLERLIAGRFDWTIFLTGEGIRRLTTVADEMGWKERFIEALRSAKILTRGPKPIQALKQLGLTNTKSATAPTTDGVIEALKTIDLAGKYIGVQLYKETNPPLTDYLTAMGATCDPVLPYIYAPNSDGEAVTQLIDAMAAGSIDAIVFTSSPQVDRLYEVATELGITEKLKAGFERTKIAAVGPVVAKTLEDAGARADIMPEQGFVMKNLASYLRRAFG